MHENVPIAATRGAALASQLDELNALYRLTDKLYRAQSLADVYDAALDAIVGTLGCSRASILLFDEAGVMSFVAWRGLSEAYRKAVSGHSPWKPGDRDPQPIFVRDIEQTEEADWIKATIIGEGIRGLAFIPLVCHGAVVGKFMTYYEAAHDFPEHEVNLAVTIARQVGFSLERGRAEAARQAAEDELRESEERFRLMSEHAPVMIWLSGVQGECLHLNQMLRTFWNVDDKAIDRFDWQHMMHPEDAPEIVRLMHDALTRQASVALKGRYLDSQGRYRIMETDARPRFSAKGEFLGMIGVNVDVTERERAEAQRELLLAELNHRVKNTLAVVQGLAHQTFKDTDPQARNAFEGRLVALAVTHNLLTEANWENASLEQLAADTLHTSGPTGARVTLSGPRILLRPREALALAMALHELYTNAVKYGALSNDTGRIELQWSQTGDPQGRLGLVWREHGGPPVSPPKRRGFGSLLLDRTLAQDLDGTVTMEFAPQGLVCSIDAPLPSMNGEFQ